MTGTLYSGLTTIGRHLHGMAFGYPDPLEIKATPQNLETAIREKGKEVLKFKFNEGSQYYTRYYTALEYAVVIGDKDSILSLIALGARVDYCSFSSMGTVVHHYIDCLTKDTLPDLAMLNILLEHLININNEEGGYFRTPLEYALTHMKDYQNIHWGVIEMLLQKGSRITDEAIGSPFMILRNSHDHKIYYEKMMRTPDEERCFLAHLVKYLTLERKYHPESTSALTMEEFKLHTFHFMNAFSANAICIDTSAMFSQMLESISRALKQHSNPETLSLKDRAEIEALPSGQQEKITGIFKEYIEEAKNAPTELTITGCASSGMLCAQFLAYHQLFKTLVKKENFIDCFVDWQLKAMKLAVAKINRASPHARMILNLLNSSGEVDNDSETKLLEEIVGQSLLDKALKPKETPTTVTTADEVRIDIARLNPSHIGI